MTLDSSFWSVITELLSQDGSLKALLTFSIAFVTVIAATLWYIVSKIRKFRYRSEKHEIEADFDSDQKTPAE